MELKLLNASNKGHTYPGKGSKKDRDPVAGGITAATLLCPSGSASGIGSAAGVRCEVRFLIVIRLVVASVACLCLVAGLPGSGVRRRAECYYGCNLQGVRRERMKCVECVKCGGAHE